MLKPGAMSFGLMSLNSMFLVQMAINGVGEILQTLFVIAMCNLQLNMVVVALWYKDA